MEDNQPAPELIAEYVERLKESYLFLRKRLRADVKRIASGQNQLWERVAVSLIREEIDPAEFVRFMFDRETINHDDVYVNMVTSMALVDEFTEKAKVSSRTKLEVIVASQLHALSIRIKDGQSVRNALTDPDAIFSAAFRYVVALGYGHHDIARTYRVAAERMMRFKPHYKRLFKDWLGASHAGSEQSSNSNCS
jgi:hypothetical protein